MCMGPGGGYYIYGDKYGNGNEEVPMRAYVKVYKEIQTQARNMGGQFDYIFLAAGTGMTQAGLIAGKIIYGGDEKIVGISVARNKRQQENVLQKMLSAYSLKHNIPVHQAYVEVIDNYVCAGYGKYNAEIIKTIRKMMLVYGIPLDPTYTGKAFWGMLQYLKKENITGKNILFIHTGGTPLFFDNMELLYKEL